MLTFSVCFTDVWRERETYRADPRVAQHTRSTGGWAADEETRETSNTGATETETTARSQGKNHKGFFARTVTVAVKVYHCANGDRRFDGQIGFRTHSVRQCKFEGDCDRDGDGDSMCKQTLRCIHARRKLSQKRKCSFYLSRHSISVACYKVKILVHSRQMKAIANVDSFFCFTATPY